MDIIYKNARAEFCGYLFLETNTWSIQRLDIVKLFAFRHSLQNYKLWSLENNVIHTNFVSFGLAPYFKLGQRTFHILMLWKAILLQFLRFAISQNTKIKCCAPLLKHTTKTRNKTSYKSFILPGIVSNITWYIYAKENLLNHYSCTLKLYFDIFHSLFCFRLKQQLLQLPRLSI